MSLYIAPRHTKEYLDLDAVGDAGPMPLEPGPPLQPPGPLRVSFRHGLGDCVHFALLLQLYRAYGYDCHVRCAADKRDIFRLAGVNAEIGEPDASFPSVPWHDGCQPLEKRLSHVWCYNKVARNLGAAPLPALKTSEVLWPELCAQTLPSEGMIDSNDVLWAEDLLRHLPRPVFLLHTRGRSYARTKNIPDDTTLEAYRKILEGSGGTVVPLDLDGNLPALAHGRVRPVGPGETSVGRLLALIRGADVLAAVDSGPLHLARFTSTPTVGLFPNTDHFAPRFCLPRAGQVNLAPGKQRAMNAPIRLAYRMIECPGPELSGAAIADACFRLLDRPRYLSQAFSAEDFQIQQFVREWARGKGTYLTPYVDRHNGWDVLLHEVRNRFPKPIVVETGCIRSEEDWAGAGYSTYLLAAFLQCHGGNLISVDHSPEHCALARRIVQETSCVEVVCKNSVQFLSSSRTFIDVLVLDSAPLEQPGVEDYTLNEVIAALASLHERSLILFDDTVWESGRFHGRGGLAVPWLLERGWRVLYSGYQTLCVQDRKSLS